MSKAAAGHIMPDDSTAISRRSMLLTGAALAAGAGSAIPPAAALSSDEDLEWPEFRDWYDLMLEEEALFRPGNTVGEAGAQDDERSHMIAARMSKLRLAMYARPVTAPVHEAILGVVALNASDRGTECIDSTGQFRSLMLGAWSAAGNEHEDFSLRVGMMLIEKTVRQAVLKNLLPGVAIYGEGGNA